MIQLKHFMLEHNREHIVVFITCNPQYTVCMLKTSVYCTIYICVKRTHTHRAWMLSILSGWMHPKCEKWANEFVVYFLSKIILIVAYKTQCKKMIDSVQCIQRKLTVQHLHYIANTFKWRLHKKRSVHDINVVLSKFVFEIFRTLL